MRETLEREIKLAPVEGFVLPELGGERLADAHLRLDLPRHARPAARAARRHVPASRRGRRGALAAQAAARRGAARARAGRAAGAAPARCVALLPAYLRGRELVPVARLRTRREGVRAPGRRDRRRQRRRARRAARRAPLSRARGRARSRATSAPCAASRRSCAGRGRRRQAAAAEAVPGARPGRALSSADRDPEGHAAGARRSGSRSREQYRRAPRATTPAPAAATTRRISTSSGSRRGACARSSGPRDRCVDADWAELVARGARLARAALGPARDLDVLLERLRAEVEALGQRRADAARACSTRSRPSGAAAYA